MHGESMKISKITFVITSITKYGFVTEIMNLQLLNGPILRMKASNRNCFTSFYVCNWYDKFRMIEVRWIYYIEHSNHQRFFNKKNGIKRFQKKSTKCDNFHCLFINGLKDFYLKHTFRIQCYMLAFVMYSMSMRWHIVMLLYYMMKKHSLFCCCCLTKLIWNRINAQIRFHCIFCMWKMVNSMCTYNFVDWVNLS